MNYADIKSIDVANGPGVRVSLFVSGCSHHCEDCFNKETWDFNFGQLFGENEIDSIIEQLSPSHIKGFSLLGGEPFEFTNQQGILPLLRKIRETYPEKDIWCWTGYLFDKDIRDTMMVKWPETKEILSYIDVLVDGRFEKDKKDLKLRFRGSSNQRIIDVQKSLEEGNIHLWEEKGSI